MVPFSPACQVIKNLNGDFGTFTLYYTLLSILFPLERTFYQHLQGRIRFNTANPFLSTGKVLMEYDQCLFLQQEDTKTPTTHVISVWDFSDIEPYQIVDNTEPRCFQSDVIFVKMFVTSILWNRSYWQLTSTMPLSLSLSR